MRIPLRLGAAAVLAGCLVAITLAAWIVARIGASNAMNAQGHRHLAAAAVLGSERMRALQDMPLDSFTTVLALATGYRVSVFDSGQRLLADSDLGAAGSPMDVAVDRTEVGGALNRTRASATRVSGLDGRRYLFSASRAFRRGEQVVLRFGAPAQPIRVAAARIALWVALAVFALGCTGLLVLDRLTRRAVGVLHDVRRFLSRLGEFQPAGARVKLPRIIELARLASAANRVRSEVEERIGRVTRERDELDQLLDQVGEGLLALSSDARVMRINPAARELLGLTEVAPLSPVGSIIRAPALRDVLEASVVRPEGRQRVSIGDRELEVRTRRGTGGGAFVLLVDITAIRRLDAVRSDFVANASHELKTPLTVIRAAAETIFDDDLPRDLCLRFARSIERNTVHLQRLVDDLLDLSRYESGAWRPQREPFSIESAAWSAWNDLEPERTGRIAAFDVQGEGEALGDRAAAYQIFRNLFENSLRYVPTETGRIVVRIRASANHFVVAVEDNGSGIPVAALPRIFERFYRVDAARSRRLGGTGLGLAIVRHLVASMGGHVDADSAWGAGTTITFTIPSAASAEDPAEQ